MSGSRRPSDAIWQRACGGARRAGGCIFVSHVVGTVLSLSLATMGYRAVPDAFSRGATPFEVADLHAAGFAAGRLVAMLQDTRNTLFALVAAQVLHATFARAWWLHVMTGKDERMGLRAALRDQPRMWGLLTLHLGIQAGWGWLLWETSRHRWLLAVDAVQPLLGDTCRLGLGGLWLLGATLLTVAHDLVFVRVLAGHTLGAALLTLGRRSLARGLLWKTAYRTAGTAAILAGLALAAATWPDRWPLATLLCHQALSGIRMGLRGLWVGTSAALASHPPRARA